MLQASPPLSFFLLAFCLLFPSRISAQQPYWCLSWSQFVCYTRKKKNKIKPVWNPICFLLCKIHHKFTSRHVRVPVLRINFSMETCTSITQNRNSPHWACPWWEEGTAGKVSVTDRQRAWGSLAHVFLKLQLWVDMFTLQTTHRLQWVQTGIFNYPCGLFPINKVLRKKENCLLACLLPGFLPSCGTQAEWLGQTPWLLWKQEIMTNEPRQWSGEGRCDDGMALQQGRGQGPGWHAGTLQQFIPDLLSPHGREAVGYISPACPGGGNSPLSLPRCWKTVMPPELHNSLTQVASLSHPAPMYLSKTPNQCQGSFFWAIMHVHEFIQTFSNMVTWHKQNHRQIWCPSWISCRCRNSFGLGIFQVAFFSKEPVWVII